MNKEAKQKWIEALRSGEFKQTQGALKRKEVDNFKYCCLGVLCEIQDDVGWRSSDGIKYANYHDSESCLFLPFDLLTDLNIKESDQSELVDMNDDGKTFEEIADYIEKNL